MTDTPTDGEREALAYLITAHRFRERGLIGAIGEPDVAVARPLADFLRAEGFHRTEVPEPSAETITKLRTWIAGEPFEVSQGRTGQPVAKVPAAQQQGYVNGYSAAVEHVAAILDAEPQGEPSDAGVDDAWWKAQEAGQLPRTPGPSIRQAFKAGYRAALRAAGVGGVR